MFNRLYFVIAFTAVFILGLDIALSAHGLKAANSHVFQIYRSSLGAMDNQITCPAAAKGWCQKVGGLPE